MELDFLKIWQKYQSVLQQRNSLLRQDGSIEQLQAWDSSLIELAEKIDFYRKKYLESFSFVFNEIADDLLGFDIKMKYESGWSSDKLFKQALADSLNRDRVMGFTQVGPHRSELKIVYKGAPVSAQLSRGQLKLLMCAMRLAQGRHLFEHTQKKCVYLVDDLAAELDKKHREKLILSLKQMQAQVFITGIEKNSFIMGEDLMNAKLFHVEHGEIKSIISQ